jgi:NADH-quinone oxidoreductase subunit H
MDSFIVISLIKIVVVFAVLMTTLAYLQWVERKVIAHIQVRPGPYRVGPHGLLQPLADVIKLITKEDLLPPYVNKPLYLLAPFLAITMALLSISVIPFGPVIHVAGYETAMQLTDLNIGVLFVLAVSSMGVYGIALAGWSSNNKYALLGGLRSSAQMISYELPLSLTIAAPLLVSNTLSLRELVERQTGGIWHWNLIHGGQIVSFLIFLIAAFAETNRVPFDLPEAENELVAGFHTEYSSMKFASFFMAEYANMITVSCMATLLFLGGCGDFRVCRSDRVVPRPASGAAPRSHLAARVRRHLLCDCRHLPAAHDAELARSAFLVLRQNRLYSFCVHVDSRHAAALSVRPADGLHVEVPLPGRGFESAGDRPGGRFGLVKWTSSFF